MEGGGLGGVRSKKEGEYMSTWSSELQSVSLDLSRDESTVSSSKPLQVPQMGKGSPASADCTRGGGGQ